MCNGVWPKHFGNVHGVTGHAVLVSCSGNVRASGIQTSALAQVCAGSVKRFHAVGFEKGGRRLAVIKAGGCLGKSAFALAPPSNESRGADLAAWPAEMPQVRPPACPTLCPPPNVCHMRGSKDMRGPRAHQATEMPQAPQLPCCALALHFCRSHMFLTLTLILTPGTCGRRSRCCQPVRCARSAGRDA